MGSNPTTLGSDNALAKSGRSLIVGRQLLTDPVVFLEFGILLSKMARQICRGRFGWRGQWPFSCSSNYVAMRTGMRRGSFMLLSHLRSLDVALSTG
jgi:hypothetical protein